VPRAIEIHRRTDPRGTAVWMPPLQASNAGSSRGEACEETLAIRAKR
jgi:hypothetical protein